jgi:glycosyltransferase involved in cell wall biosynthesis
MADDPHISIQDVTGRALLARLEAENAALRARLEVAELSAAAQAMRAGSKSWEAAGLSQQMAQMRRSLFWRATLPLRIAVDLARGAPRSGSPEAYRIGRLIGIVRHQGVAAAMDRVRAYRRAQAAGRREPVRAVQTGRRGGGAAAEQPVPAAAVLAPSVLIVAELSVPQCAKYRVWQKQEMIRSLGVTCTVVDWRRTYECISAACLATQAILYRVPASLEIRLLIETLRGLGVTVAWEVDDLIFDRALYAENSNLRSLPAALQRELLHGVELYRQAMLAAGCGIASTPELADAMTAAGVRDVTVIENALDGETLALAADIRAARRPRGDTVLITYGSGTRTHDADFAVAAPALLDVLANYRHARLRIVGALTLPAAFAALADRIEIIETVPFARYLALLGESDIAIAPLEATQFNDAKSNIKFLEASVLGIASVCSPRTQFRRVVTHGENGLLAEGVDAWRDALGALVADRALRERLGRAALDTALRRYAPDAVARDQVAPFLAQAFAERKTPALRVLIANVFFPPQTYGGATIVAAEMARLLHAMDGTEVYVATTRGTDHETPAMGREWWQGIPVFEIPVPPADIIADFDNPEVTDAFIRILDAVRPDVVHLHAMQTMGAGMAAACREREIPYVITLHDAWWICGRQFMVTGEGRYCQQIRIDLRVCQACMSGALHLEVRSQLLLRALQGAALLLSPSEAHRQVYLAQGFAPEKIVVAANGVRLPPADFARRVAPHIRFAYVGGYEVVKGYQVLKAAFEGIEAGGWELILVDNTQNIGFSSLDAASWSVKGTLTILPAYTQDTLDDFFAGIDVLVFPSQWKESFGLTVREAIARGLWVIATEGGGAAEAITAGVNGTLIPMDGRHEALQAAIQDLLAGKPDPRAARPAAVSGGAIIGYQEQAERLRGTLMSVARGVRASA